MGLDWFTLIAQIVNFLVLVWLLKHLFYGRVIRAMNEREARIAGRLEEAEAHRQQLMDAARLETETAQAQWLEMLKRERWGLLQDFRERLGQEVFALTRHGLKELADADLEQQIGKVFVERLETLDAAEREAIVAAVRDSDHEVEIRTAFAVPEEARERLSQFLRQRLDDRIQVASPPLRS
jgi:F-type H+-transporting ATPase subunit b